MAGNDGRNKSNENGYISSDSDVVCLDDLSPNGNKKKTANVRNCSSDNYLADEIQKKITLKNNCFSKLGMEDFYTKDIYIYLKVLELKYRPSSCHASLQVWKVSTSRRITIDILIYLSGELELEDEVLHLAVSYIDRFLSVVQVSGNDLVVAGLACLLIASKYDSIDEYDAKELFKAVQSFCPKRKLKDMEVKILSSLSFELNDPTVYRFLNYMCFTMDVPDVIRHLAQLIAEIAFKNLDMLLQYVPSQIAAGAIYTANFVAQIYTFDCELEVVSGYKIQEIIRCVDFLHKGFLEFRELPSEYLYDKFKSEDFMCISDLIISKSPTSK